MNNSRILTTFCALFSLIGLYAAEVTTVAGGLKDLVADKSATELTVKGDIDARDIKFISDEMPNLHVLNLKDANIKAFSASEEYFGGQKDYEAGVLPSYCFFAKKYTSIVLPSTLKSVGEASLAGCTEIATINIPNGVDSIGNSAFNGCKALKGIVIPSTIKTIGDYAFARSGVESADLSGMSASGKIGVKVFSNCDKLANVVLPINCTAIVAGMFSGCSSLTQISLPTSIESIGEEAFMQTGLKSIDLSGCTALKTIGMWAFANVPVENLTVAPNIESIGEGAFFYNSTLKGITLPSNVKEMSDFMLAGCSEITAGPIVGEGVTKIGRFSFADMKKMNNPELPTTVNYIGDKAFENTVGMTELKVNATIVPQLGDSVFAGIKQPMVKLKVPEASIPLYKAADQWKEFLITDLTNVELQKTNSDIKAFFVGKELNIKASLPINRASVYDPSGVLLAVATPGSETAQIDTANFSGNLYIVIIVLETGEAKTIKLIRR